MPSLCSCVLASQSWHIAMPSGESGIHPISGELLQKYQHDSGHNQDILGEPATEIGLDTRRR
jgi:hypothetical protein